MKKVKNCQLCDLKKITNWHFENDDFVVLDCDTCNVPMYVWRDHEFPSKIDVLLMINHSQKHFPDRKINFRRRKIPEHYHFHMREK